MHYVACVLFGARVPHPSQEDWLYSPSTNTSTVFALCIHNFTRYCINNLIMCTGLFTCSMQARHNNTMIPLDSMKPGTMEWNNGMKQWNGGTSN